MKTRLIIIASALMTALLSLPASAQPGPGMDGMGGKGQGMSQGMANGPQASPGKRAPRDCTKSRNPEACTAHQQARQQAQEVCKDKAGPERKQCMTEQRRNFDCTKSANPQRCEERKQVYQACAGQTGPAFRQCAQQKMPPPDCSKAKNPNRCTLHQQAREACKDKLGSEHRRCLHQQFNAK